MEQGNKPLWAARDRNDTLCLFTEKPHKNKQLGMWQGDIDFAYLPNKLMPEVKWSDEEPTEVEITIKA